MRSTDGSSLRRRLRRAALFVLSLALGDRSRDLLDGLRGWMARHNAVIMAVLFLLIGAKLIGDAVSGFSS